MDCQDYITTEPERKRGQQLGPEERGALLIVSMERINEKIDANLNPIKRPETC